MAAVSGKYPGRSSRSCRTEILIPGVITGSIRRITPRLGDSGRPLHDPVFL